MLIVVKKMKILFITERLDADLSEGFNNIIQSLVIIFQKSHNVKIITTQESTYNSKEHVNLPSSRTFRNKRLKEYITSYKPNIVIYIPYASATIGSWYRFTNLKTHYPEAKYILVLLQNRKRVSLFSWLFRRMENYHIISISSLLFNKLIVPSTNKSLLPIGVDINRFTEGTYEEKCNIRKEIGLSIDSKVFLHVGHLQESRNIQSIMDLVLRDPSHVLLLVTATEPHEIDNSNPRILTMNGYFDSIEQFYRLSDCYIFPAEESYAAVALPLTILEALSCKLCVFTTKFDSVPYFLDKYVSYISTEISQGKCDDVDYDDFRAHFNWEVVIQQWDKLLY